MMPGFLRHQYDSRHATAIAVGVSVGMFIALVLSNLVLSGVAYGIRQYQVYSYMKSVPHVSAPATGAPR